MDFIRAIRQKIHEGNLMFVYRGVVTVENTSSLLMLLEKEMESSEFGFQGRKRLFMFVLESLQNVSRHSTSDDYSEMSLVMYSRRPDGYTVTTGNVIETSQIGNLKKKLEEINNLEPGEIRTVYRQMLNASEFSTKGGAGLGLIEMAKKTGNRLDYDFVQLDGDYSYFILSKTVDSKGTGFRTGSAGRFEGRSVSELEQLMASYNIYMIWSGHFSPDVSKEVLSFAETRLSEGDTDTALRRKVFGVLVEALDNVARHNPGQTVEEQYGMPLVLIRFKEKEYTITTGNLIENDKISPFRQKLDTINNADREGLKNLLKQSLMNQQMNVQSTGNLGLIEMARKSDGKLNYNFEKINDRYSYFILEVKVSGR
ncbi:MAG TPA: SiaB family protein kinase [Bacteroidales bacterium]|nr:SiaB family protein kinase [Bacteroidales bacterium]HRT90327.1 SiaB family protein kinase [Bacteroidales bacterium]